MINKLAVLDNILARRHCRLFQALESGITIDDSFGSDLKNWYLWKNGYKNNEELFLSNYYFQSFDEGISFFHSSQDNSIFHSIILYLLDKKSLHSIPLIIDGSGDGYYYDIKNREVYYRFEGEKDIYIKCFEGFLDILIELASLDNPSDDDIISTEIKLLDDQ